MIFRASFNAAVAVATVSICDWSVFALNTQSDWFRALPSANAWRRAALRLAALVARASGSSRFFPKLLFAKFCWLLSPDGPLLNPQSSENAERVNPPLWLLHHGGTSSREASGAALLGFVLLLLTTFEWLRARFARMLSILAPKKKAFSAVCRREPETSPARRSLSDDLVSSVPSPTEEGGRGGGSIRKARRGTCSRKEFGVSNELGGRASAFVVIGFLATSRSFPGSRSAAGNGG